VSTIEMAITPNVLTLDPKAGAIDDVAGSDGLDVTNERRSPLLPRGLLVIQDGQNEGPQNFELFAWEEVAGNRLLVGTTSSAR